jgi:hypothetical protein
MAANKKNTSKKSQPAKALKKKLPEAKRQPKKIGRPSSFTQEIADRICAEIATTSKSLKTICSPEDMPSVVTVMTWLRSNEDFLNQYARAKEEQADFLAEEILEISDDGTNDFMTITKGDQEYTVENKEWTSRSKLRVEARKWIASKLKPKKYGEKIDHTTDGESLNKGAKINLSNVPLETLLELARHVDDTEVKG